MVIVGFCKVEENPGPDHDQDSPAPPVELRVNVPPAVTGLLLPAEADGVARFCEMVIPAVDVQPFAPVTVTV